MSRSTMLSAALVALGLAGAPAAHAQDGMSFEFDLNSVLIATFEADQPFLEPESERVRNLVERALADAYVVVRMSEVPPFTDYSADIYLRSCPGGQYIGCVFVVGGRAETDWTIGGRISAVEGGYRVDMSFIDVSEAKLVLEFDVVLDGSNDAEFQEGVIRVLDALVNGEVQDLDMRGDPEAQRRAEAESDKRAALAREFAVDSMYEDTQDLERGDVGLDAYVGDLDDDGDDRVTFQELDEMENAGGLTPWERAGLTKSQYKLYRNSKMKLRDFKARMQGRRGEVLIRAGIKVSQGPWDQAHHTGIVLKDGTLPNKPGTWKPADITQQTALQLNVNGLAIGGELELALGVTPWMEVGVFGGLHSSKYTAHFAPPELAGSLDPLVAKPKEEDFGSRIGWYAGAKIGFAPMPAYPARPTLHLGASYWQGSSVLGVVNQLPALYIAQSQQMTGNNLILVHAQPGFEVNAGKRVLFFARADIDLPVAGRFFQNLTYQLGGKSLPYTRQAQFLDNYPGGGLFAEGAPQGNFRGAAEGAFGIGVGATIGIAVRFRYAGLR